MAKANGNVNVAVPTFIPLTDAARKYNISENVLTRLIQDGRIDAAQLASRELLVSDEGLNEKTKEQIRSLKRSSGTCGENPSRSPKHGLPYRLKHPELFKYR
jgi:hypothetical protein